MTLYDDLKTDMDEILRYGHPVRLKYYISGPENFGFDDSISISQSGTDIWTSGLAFPVKGKFGSSESLLLQQGKIKHSDKKLFIRGDIETTSTMKIGIGSPPTEHFLIVDGVESYPPLGTIVYKKMYVRELQTGSFIGEE